MITKCLFPAAGYGTRFLPATKATPKEMLPILTKPLIQYAVEEALEADISNMAIVTGRGKRAIEDHFDISYELEHQIKGTSKESLLTDIRDVITHCTFSYIRQVEMKGLGHAILTGEPLIGNEPFAVILADDLCVGEGSEFRVPGSNKQIPNPEPRTLHKRCSLPNGRTLREIPRALHSSHRRSSRRPDRQIRCDSWR